MSPTGHLAIGFAAKKYATKIPLIVFLIASYAIDLIYFVFLGFGIDTVEYAPWSHSLLMVMIWSMLAMFITQFYTKRFLSGLLIGLVVLSHWLLDFIVWNDLLISFDKRIRVGFGLYNKIGFSQTNFLELTAGTAIASAIELSLLIFGVVIYVLDLRKSKKGKTTFPL